MAANTIEEWLGVDIAISPPSGQMETGAGDGQEVSGRNYLAPNDQSDDQRAIGRSQLPVVSDDDIAPSPDGPYELHPAISHRQHWLINHYFVLEAPVTGTVGVGGPTEGVNDRSVDRRPPSAVGHCRRHKSRRGRRPNRITDRARKARQAVDGHDQDRRYVHWNPTSSIERSLRET